MCMEPGRLRKTCEAIMMGVTVVIPKYSAKDVVEHIWAEYGDDVELTIRNDKECVILRVNRPAL